jgi:flagellar L-ring protein precursor FlgH
MDKAQLLLRFRLTAECVRRVLCVVVVLIVGVFQQAIAQDASLLLVPPLGEQQKGPLTLENSSFIYRRLPPESVKRELKINDIVTVLVDYRSSMLSEGDANAQRTTGLSAVLSDWLKFDGKDLFPAPLNRGDPKIRGQLDSEFEAEADTSTNDSLTFRIGAQVIDIRPNGNLVIEARREIQINEEMWIQSLTGVVRRQSIGPDRTVRSDEIAELRIEKKEKGFVRESYQRGWFTKWYDTWKPF